MIRTLDDRFLKHVKELKVGDIFRTNRNGTLPWSRWFFVTRGPRLGYHLAPRKGKRYEVRATPVPPNLHSRLHFAGPIARSWKLGSSNGKSKKI
jgi:hypothetical protein